MSEQIRPRLDSWWERYTPTLRALTQEQAFQLFENGAPLNLETDACPIEGMEVKSVWQNGGGRWLTSYKNTKTSDKNIWEEIREDVLVDFKKHNPKKPKIKRTKGKAKNLHLLSIPDIHFGKEDLKATNERLDFVVDDLLSRIKTKDNEFLLVIGNDVIHTDFNQSTTKGTQLFAYAEPREVFRTAWKAMVRVTDKLLSLGTVHIIHITSNHDYYSGGYLADLIGAYYSNNENVTMDNSFDDRKYYQFGLNGFMFEHGELKPQDYPILLATERPKLWAETKFRAIFVGHLHHQITKQLKGCILRYLPSISGKDAYHSKHGYIAPQQAQMYIYESELGLRTIHEVTV